MCCCTRGGTRPAIGVAAPRGARGSQSTTRPASAHRSEKSRVVAAAIGVARPCRIRPAQRAAAGRPAASTRCPGRETTTKFAQVENARDSRCHVAISANASAPMMKNSSDAPSRAREAGRACRTCTTARRGAVRRRRPPARRRPHRQRHHREPVKGRGERLTADAAGCATAARSTSVSPSARRGAPRIEMAGVNRDRRCRRGCRGVRPASFASGHSDVAGRRLVALRASRSRAAMRSSDARRLRATSLRAAPAGPRRSPPRPRRTAGRARCCASQPRPAAPARRARRSCWPRRSAAWRQALARGIASGTARARADGVEVVDRIPSGRPTRRRGGRAPWCVRDGAGTDGRGPGPRARLRSSPGTSATTKLRSPLRPTTPRFGVSVVNG